MKPLREHTIPEIIGGGGVCLGIIMLFICSLFGVDVNSWKIQWQPYPLYPQRIGQVSYSETSKQHQASFTSASSLDETFAWYDQRLAEELFRQQINVDTATSREKTYYLCTGMVITVLGEAHPSRFTITMRKGFPMRSPPSCSQFIFKNQAIPLYPHHQLPVATKGAATLVFTSSSSISETLDWYTQTLTSQAFQINLDTKKPAITQMTYHLCNGINIIIIAEPKTGVFQVSKQLAWASRFRPECKPEQ